MRRVVPASEEEMNKQPRGDGDTICCLLRELYQGSTDEAVRYKLRIAVAMAKSMVAKLVWYKMFTNRFETDEEI